MIDQGKPYKIVYDGTDREEWLIARQHYVGASDELSDSKAKAKAGLTEPFTGNRHTFFGELLELPTIQGFHRWTGMWTKPLGHDENGSKHLMFASREHPIMAATLDGWCRVPDAPERQEKLVRYLEKDLGHSEQYINTILSDTRNAILEVKTPGWWKLHEWGETEAVAYRVKGQKQRAYYQKWVKAWDDPTQVPTKYYTQVQHQMFVMGVDVAWLLAMVGGKRFVSYRIERDEKAIDERVRACYAFMKKVEEYKNWNPLEKIEKKNR